MKVLYLVNLYPKVSHTFIRREIEGVEACGVEVERVSLRRVSEPLVDPVDRAEELRTWVVLDAGVVGLLRAVLSIALRRPRRLCSALRDAIRLGRRSERGVVYHIAYLAEACALACRYASGIDHVHAHFATNPAAVALLWNRLGGPPYSFTAHGTLDFDNPPAVSLAEKIHRARFAIAVCQYGRGQMMRWTDEADWNKLHVVRCGVEESFLDQAPVPIPSAPRLVCVARFSPEKALSVLLRALHRLVSEGREVELILAGDGPEREKLCALIAELGLGQHVRLTGLLSGPQVREAILGARAMVLTSFSEGLPVVIMEALALGRPVVASSITGIPELIQQGVTGWLFPVGSIEELAQALREVLERSPNELALLGRQGAQRVARLHDARVEAARLAQLFQSGSDQHERQSASGLTAEQSSESSRVA